MILVIIHNQTFRVEKEIAIGSDAFYVAREVTNISDRLESKETHLIRKSALQKQECYVPRGKMSENDCFPIPGMMYHIGFISAQPVIEKKENKT